MTTYAMIERTSGYIWGVVIAQSPTEACRLVDENANFYGRRYAEVYSGDDWTYVVHEMPDGWECDNGKNADKIDELSKHKVAAYVSAKNASDLYYDVMYYYPVGHENADERKISGTKDECLDYIRRAIGCEHGTWNDYDGTLCYHESDDEGCGGYYIEVAW